MSIDEPEPLVSRSELVATLFKINDIAVDVERIKAILEGEDEEEADQ